MKVLKIGYFADGPWAHGALKLLVDDPGIEIVFICARFGRPDEYLRKQALEIGVEFFVIENVNQQEFIDAIKAFDADLFVSMSFDQILRKPLYSLPPMGTINCHAGKLPSYRGRNVLNWVLINDEKEFGITVHYIDDGVDTGDVILQSTFTIDDTDDYASLLKKAFSECPLILHQAIQALQTGNAQRIKQSTISNPVLICTQRMPGDEFIDWNCTSREIFNFVRALSDPGPKATTHIGSNQVKINRVQFIPNACVYKGIPGAILSKENDGFLVKTGDSYLQIIDWSSNVRLKVGARLQ